MTELIQALATFSVAGQQFQVQLDPRYEEESRSVCPRPCAPSRILDRDRAEVHQEEEEEEEEEEGDGEDEHDLDGERLRSDD